MENVNFVVSNATKELEIPLQISNLNESVRLLGDRLDVLLTRLEKVSKQKAKMVREETKLGQTGVELADRIVGIRSMVEIITEKIDDELSILEV